ncbi:hypothetical protein GWI33_000408, partial [Rhynchophorus ferrugineus]
MAWPIIGGRERTVGNAYTPGKKTTRRDWTAPVT